MINMSGEKKNENWASKHNGCYNKQDHYITENSVTLGNDNKIIKTNPWWITEVDLLLVSSPLMSPINETQMLYQISY